ncbi:MAG: DUF4340 domain-containing protein [Clostridiales bacterium]|nr:DUF4340 domain-containing protein [Clostridiales bacterium]
MKRSMKMAVLLVVLAAFAGGYVAVTRLPASSTTVTEEEGQFALYAGDADSLAALEWTDGGTEWRFEKRDGEWQKAGEPGFPVNQTVLDTLAEKAASLTATRALSDAANPADYGLAEPAFTLTLTDADGVQTALTLGDATPFEDGYYVGVSGQGTIYTVKEDFSASFDLTASELAQMEEIPQVESYACVTVSGAVNAAYDAQTDTWVDAETGEPLDTEAVESLATDIKALSWSALVTANATDEELASWQLDDLSATSAALYDEDGSLLLGFMLGAENEDGDVYARLPDSRMVYLFMAEDVGDILSSSADTLWRKQPVTLAYEALSQAAFTFDGGSVTVAPPRAGEAAEAAEGEESAEAADSAEAPEDPGESLWTALTALTGTARIEAQPEGEALLSVAITDMDGAHSQVGFYAYDVDSYLVPVTDSHAMLVPADGVDKLIRMLRQM